MNEYPDFMRKPANAISKKSQSQGIDGYVFDGADGSQMAIWQCTTNGISQEHVHEYDEYMVVVQGQYTLSTRDGEIELKAGHEHYIQRNLPHSGKWIAGTRTIHAFGGTRATRASEEQSQTGK
jgi:quercetin dioxygenase-like cupin family protein